MTKRIDYSGEIFLLPRMINMLDILGQISRRAVFTPQTCHCLTNLQKILIKIRVIRPGTHFGAVRR